MDNLKYVISHKSSAAKERATKENQDCYGVVQRGHLVSKNLYGELLAAISDGMGGLNDPAEASYSSINSSLQFLLINDRINSNILGQAVVHANDSLLSKADGRDMGATLTLVEIHGNELNFAHIGDCRLILGKNNAVEILSDDHTKLAKKLSLRNPGLHIVKTDSSSKKLAKSLGEKFFTIDYIQVSLNPLRLEKGDVIILCSDGAWTELEPEEMIKIAQMNPTNAAEKIVEEACKRDSTDDVTAITIGCY